MRNHTHESRVIDPAELTRGFASDNYSGVHPQVIDAIAAANVGHASAYGSDPFSSRFEEVMREHFGDHALSYPVFNGTGANVTTLQSLVPRWGAVIAAHSSHINNDEGGAPEKVGGLKLLTVATPDGKLTPELIDREAWGWGNVHRSQPLAVSLTQTTELGTCYTVNEIRDITEHAHARGMRVHLDGARISNAAAHLGKSLSEFTTDVGVDIVSLGGTKNGLLGAEAIVVLNDEALQGLPFLRKMNMQLASKLRFISAQLTALYEGNLWLRSAQHANEMAQLLRVGIERIISSDPANTHGITLPYRTESNAVFVTLPDDLRARAHEHTRFYDWPESPNLVRLMCSFDTTEDDVEALLSVISNG